MQGFNHINTRVLFFFLSLTIWYLDIRKCYKLPLFMRLWYIQEYMWFVVYAWTSVKDFSVISWGWYYKWVQKAVLIKNCQTESIFISKILSTGITFVSIASEVRYAPLTVSKIRNWFKCYEMLLLCIKLLKFCSVVCKDLEVEEDAPSSAIRDLKSFRTLLNIPLPAMQERIPLHLTAVTGRNSICLLGLAIIIWEGNASLAGKKETFPCVNSCTRWLQFLWNYLQIPVLGFR